MLKVVGSQGSIAASILIKKTSKKMSTVHMDKNSLNKKNVTYQNKLFLIYSSKFCNLIYNITFRIIKTY